MSQGGCEFNGVGIEDFGELPLSISEGVGDSEDSPYTVASICQSSFSSVGSSPDSEGGMLSHYGPARVSCLGACEVGDNAGL